MREYEQIVRKDRMSVYFHAFTSSGNAPSINNIKRKKVIYSDRIVYTFSFISTTPTVLISEIKTKSKSNGSLSSYRTPPLHNPTMALSRPPNPTAHQPS